MSEPIFELWDRHTLLPLLRFVDVEASGLHDRSFPLQFGWCGLDLKTSVALVRPQPEWTPELYSEESFDIHGIAYETAVREGVPAMRVAGRLNEDLVGKAVISDSPSWDGYWTKRLADSTGIDMKFGYNDFARIAETFGPVCDRWCVAHYHRIVEVVDLFYPHTHKADEDALRMAALTRMLLDRTWCEWLLDRPRTEIGSLVEDLA
jgi:hypothetical protein